MNWIKDGVKAHIASIWRQMGPWQCFTCFSLTVLIVSCTGSEQQCEITIAITRQQSLPRLKRSYKPPVFSWTLKMTTQRNQTSLTKQNKCRIGQWKPLLNDATNEVADRKFRSMNFAMSMAILILDDVQLRMSMTRTSWNKCQWHHGTIVNDM